MKKNFAVSISGPLAQTHLVSGWFQSASWVLGNFDDELHGVFGLVTESPPNGVHRMLMCDTLEGLSIYWHQLESSLHTQKKREISRKVQMSYLIFDADVCFSDTSLSIPGRVQTERCLNGRKKQMLQAQDASHFLCSPSLIPVNDLICSASDTVYVCVCVFLTWKTQTSVLLVCQWLQSEKKASISEV